MFMKAKGIKLTLLTSLLLILIGSGCGLKIFKKKVKQEPITKAKIDTEYGTIIIKLYNETPQHRDNFIKLVKDGFYTDLLFHRVMQNFMIQGGDPESKNAPADKMLGSSGPGYTIPAEFDSSFIHKKGALAAARQPDQVNPAKASSGSQFYIAQGQVYDSAQLQMMAMRTGMQYTAEQQEIYATLGGTPHLDMGYTIFGEVIEGLDVVDKIAAVQVGMGNRPIKDVKFTITLIEE